MLKPFSHSGRLRVNANTTDPSILPPSSLPVDLPETTFNPVSADILTSTRLQTAPLSNVAVPPTSLSNVSLSVPSTQTNPTPPCVVASLPMISGDVRTSFPCKVHEEENNYNLYEYN